VVVLFDEVDGRPVALLDAEPLTALRTAATATVAMRALARPDARRIAVIGTGVQAAAQLAVLAALDTPAEAVVAGRDADRAHALATTCPGVTGAPSIEAAVRGAEVVLCCTGARTPVFDPAWLRPGAHVSSIGGSDGPELDAAVLRGGSLFVEWPGAVTCPPPAGAHELQGLAEDDAVLLGAVLSGRHPGRRSDDELTVFKSTGHAALDVAAAHVAAATARPGPTDRQS
jgi:alanine dehydrogenase